jgi:excisionase family DNA binding protein
MFLTVADAAEIVNVSESTVRKWISTGALSVTQPVGPGHLVRIDEEHLALFLAAGLRGGPWK